MFAVQNIIYSFDPRAGHSSDEEIRYETSSRYLSPTKRTASWQHDDGGEEMSHQVADIMAATRPLRLRA